MATPLFKTACRVCRDRKVKCDKTLPCHNCTVAGVSCTFPPQVRTVRRPKRAGGSAKMAGADVQSLADRLGRLEELLGSRAREQAGAGLPFGLPDMHPVGQSVGPRNEGVAEDRAEDQAGELTPEHEATTTRQTSATGDAPGSWSPTSSALSPQADPAVDGYWQRLEQECASHVFFKTTPPEMRPSPPPLSPQLPPTGAGFPFGHGPGSRLPDPPALPSLAQRRVCWACYVENVDPLLKILHKPTVENLMVVDEAEMKTRPAYAPTVALIHAICLLAVISMPAAEVADRLGCERNAMITKYASQLEQALIAANFLDTHDLTTMQALLLYLYYLKHQEDPRLYSLRGMTIFLAARLGLNRDGQKDIRENSSRSGYSGSCRLTIELRRRLWWQLITLVDHPDDCATDYAPPSVGADTRLPLNVNDIELGSGKGASRVDEDRMARGSGIDLENGNDNDDRDNEYDEYNDRRGFTESSFCLMQYEITRLFHRIRFERVQVVPQRAPMALDSAEERLHASRRRMELQYFQVASSASTSPLSRFAADAIAMILTKRRVLMHIAPDISARNMQLSPTEHDQLFLLAIHVLELSRTLQTARSFSRWRWLNDTYFQWSVASFVARDLTRRCSAAATTEKSGSICSSPAIRRAWHVIDGILDNWPAATRNSPKAATLRGLIADAFRSRNELVPISSWTFTPSPMLRTFCPSRAPAPSLPPEPIHVSIPANITEETSKEASHSWSTALSQTASQDNYFLLPETNMADGSFVLDFDMLR